ncbi:dTDP-glucose 4,6-dehydratase [bacterium]|nr:dTDP-glucose 4,6-dehydratase [bacterium]
MPSTLLITGGAGFIGSSLVRLALKEKHTVVVLDSLTYAGSLENLAEVLNDITFVQGDINDASLVEGLLAEHKPQAILNLAAETHVDNSIHAAEPFIETNIRGTYTLLEAARCFHANLKGKALERFRFIQVSTDEVFGDAAEGECFSETSPYRPSSPYSASKAAADHLVMAWHRTYGLPAIITHCSNNYGPRQHAEKLIPTIVRSALAGKPIPIYGDGKQVRDWLYVDDHSRGLLACVKDGVPGTRYCFGGKTESTNIDLATNICSLLDGIKPQKTGKPYSSLIKHVTDRLGHDRRYAIDPTHAQYSLNWKPTTNLTAGLKHTIRHMLAG